MQSMIMTTQDISRVIYITLIHTHDNNAKHKLREKYLSVLLIFTVNTLIVSHVGPAKMIH